MYYFQCEIIDTLLQVPVLTLDAWMFACCTLLPDSRFTESSAHYSSNKMLSENYR